MEDTHADVVHGDGSDFALFEFQIRYTSVKCIAVGVLIGVYREQNTSSRRSPVISYLYLCAVIPQFRNLEKLAKRQGVELRVAFWLYACSLPFGTWIVNSKGGACGQLHMANSLIVVFLR